MTLTMKSKTPVKFEFDDGIAETAVVIPADADEATIVAKLRRVLELAGAGAGPRDLAGTVAAVGRPRPERPGTWETTTTTTEGGNGWKRYKAPEVPERLSGEIEMEDGS